MQPLIDFFGIKNFAPHGYCLSWSPILLWLHVASDLLITLAYYSIPLILVYFIRQRKDFPYPWLSIMFAGFIVACGTTHLLSAITIWTPLYWLEGLLKAFTAIISVATAVLMLWVIPRVLSLPSTKQLQAEIEQRKIAEESLRVANVTLQKNIACTQLMLDSALDGIISMDQSGNVIGWNTQAEHIFGYSGEQALGCELAELIIPPVHRESHRQGISRFMATGASNIIGKRLEITALRADASEFPIELTVGALKQNDSYFFSAFVRNISDRKLMEEKLLDSHDFNVSILNSLSSHIAVLDAQGIIVAVNSAWQQFAGENGLLESNQNMLGLNYLDACKKAIDQSSCDEANTAYAGIEAVLAGELDIFHLEYPCHSPIRQRWFHMTVLPLQGVRRGVVVSHEEITDRKIMENELKASEAKFRSIIEVCPVPLAMHDGQLNVTYLNQAFVQAFGYNMDDIPTLTEWRLKAYPDPDYRGWIEATWRKTLETAEQRQTAFPPLELSIRCRDDGVKTVLATAAAFHYDLSGEQLVILYDITQRKQFEDKLNSIFNAAVEGIITYDMSGTIVSSNAAVETIFGYQPEELVGCSICKLMPSSPNCSLPPQAGQFVGQIREVEGVHKNGSVMPLDLSIAEYSIDNISYFTNIVRDVSLRKYQEQQDKKHLDELAHVTRLGLMGEMASGIAHEVNQPLTAVSSYTQVSLNLINAENPDLVRLSEILYKTQQQALRAGRIIHRMREFVKSHAKHRLAADINSLIHEAVSLCIAELKQNGIKLRFELNNHLPSIYVDHIQIEQVIINLIRNSADALQNLPAKQFRQIVIHSQLTSDNEILVRVKDNGEGLDEEQQQQILTPFYTTKTDGMGMGLSISQSIIKAHKGTLYFKSKPGKGTSFYFTLPIRKQSDE